MHRRVTLFVSAAIAVGAASCVRVKEPALQPSANIPGATLWKEPADLPSRDLFYGPWGRNNAPDPDATFALVEMKHSGINPGMTVQDSQGREWSVKQAQPGGFDSEASAEVAVSRLLSAIGYHQPPVYFLPVFTLKNDFRTHTEPGGRFRLKTNVLKEVEPWKWEDNPFIGSKPYQGLLVLMMMVNNTDLKNSNNSTYEHQVGDLVEQWFVVRDVGASLGDTHRFAPRKSNPAAFERQLFTLGLDNGHVEFAYEGWYRKLIRDRITPDDVAWVSALLAELRDNQWQDAFRAAGYTPEDAGRFIRKLREKVEEGRALPQHARAN
jgi:hypothetical protein